MKNGKFQYIRHYNKKFIYFNWFHKQENNINSLKINYAVNKIKSNQSKNILIKSDNLKGLHFLNNDFKNKIKFIYIDPPYNTNKYAFAFKDVFGSEYAKNPETNISDWLCFMLPRLQLAKELLKDDGIIFLSINSKMSHYLKLLCDDVFGVACFGGELIWQTKNTVPYTSNNLFCNHETILFYYKVMPFKFKGLTRECKDYKNPDNDPRGAWSASSVYTTLNKRKHTFDITNPETKQVYPTPPNKACMYSKETITRLFKENKLIYPNGKQKEIRKKIFKSDMLNKPQPFPTLLNSFDKTTTKLNGPKEIKKLLDCDPIGNSKPVNLIEFLINQVNCKDDYILDFFAGSGTTGQAVIRSNNKLNLNNKFILIQQSEILKHNFTNNKFNNMFDVLKVRIEKSFLAEYKENINNFDADFNYYSID